MEFLNNIIKILDLLKSENLTTNQIANKTGINKKTVSSTITKLKKQGRIKVVGKEGRANIYSIDIKKEISQEIKPQREEIFDLSDNPKFIDSLLFTYLSSFNKPSYSKIKGFFSTLGIVDKSVLKAIFRNLDKKLLKMENIPEGEYSKVLKFLINNADLFMARYPFTMSFQETFQFFKSFGIQDIKNFVNFMKKLSERYPEFIILSSSRVGYTFDLFTFKKIFLEEIKFTPSGAWSVN